MMGGEKHVESAPDLGSTFWFAVEFDKAQSKAGEEEEE